MQRRKHSILVRAICLPLCLSFIAPQLQAFSYQPEQTQHVQSQIQYSSPEDYLKNVFPHFEELRSAPPLPSLPSIDKNDPILDQDPFFARSQRWQSNKSNSKRLEELSYSKNLDSTLKLELPYGMPALEIAQLMSPQLNTQEFVILSADLDSKIFEEKSPLAETPDEGIFFIDTQELYRASSANSPVYIYFLPLGGTGWKGDLQAETFGPNQFIVQSQDNQVQLIDEGDLKSIRDMGRLNALFGAYLASTDFSLQALDAELDKQAMLFPARGSTMAFGSVFTGINLENDQASISNDKTSFNQWIHDFGEILLPTAHAMVAPDVMADLSAKIYSFLGMMGGAFTISLAAKYAFKDIREKLKRNRELRQESKEKKAEENKTKPSNSIWGLWWTDFSDHYISPLKKGVARATPTPVKVAWREFVEANDVLAHGLYANFQIPTVLFPDVLEYLQDRLIPSISAADNTMLRKIQNWTTYYVRKMNLDGKVNARTLALAGILMGIIATASIYVQLMWVVPVICGGMAPFLWEAAQQRIEERMGGTSEATLNYIVNNTFRSFYGWTMGGPAGFFVETRSQLEVFIKQETENYMKKEGKNPHAPEHQAEFDKLTREKVDEMLAMLGLPRDKEFLFDLRTIERKFQRSIGYNGDPTKDIADPDRKFYLGEDRIGMVKGSIPTAIHIARRKAKENTDDTETSKKALEILLKVKSKQDLTSLTYTGPPAHKLSENTPKTWIQKYGRAAAEEAAYIYRKAFLSLLYGNKDMRKISAVTRETFGGDARNLAQVEAEEKNLSPLETERFFESTIYKATAQVEAEKEINKFKPYVEDALAKAQRKKSLSKTRAKVEALTQQRRSKTKAPHIVHVKSNEFYKIYAETFASGLGMETIPDENITEEEIRNLYTEVHARTKQLTIEEFSNNTGMQGFLKSLKNPREKQTFIAHQYARNYLQIYKELTVDTNQVRPHSPAQPGITQKIRQTSAVKKSKVLTGLLRFVDSFFGVEVGYQPGIKAAFYRLWPNFLGGYDFTSSIERTLKFFPSVIGFRWPYYLMWGMNFPVETYMLLGSLNFAMMAPAQWLKRLSSQNGLQPTGNVKSAVAYSSIYAWTSFLGNIPVMLLGPDKSDPTPSLVNDPPSTTDSLPPMHTSTDPNCQDPLKS